MNEIEPMVEKMVELRKGKMTEEQVREALSKIKLFLGTMLVKMGKSRLSAWRSNIFDC